MSYKQMATKLEQGVSSPKNVTVNVLNGNHFFGFDYQLQERLSPMHQTMNNFLLSQEIEQQRIKSRQTMKSIYNDSYVKSAQYSRKFLNPHLNKLSIYAYRRIRKVDAMIEESKKKQSSLEHYQIKAFRQSTCLPNLKANQSQTERTNQCQTERANRSQQKSGQKQTILKNLTIDPESIEDNNNKSEKIGKRTGKNMNTFAQNYKNRRKLLDRTVNKKQNNHGNSIRWDSKPEDIVNITERTKHWSPYNGKLIETKKQDLIKTVEGNKIRYAHHEPKYFKGKLQQIHKI